jgi:putative heme-binding domain-containing protein
LAVPAVTLDIADGKDGHDAACKVYRLSPFEPWRIERARRNRERGAWWVGERDRGKAKTPNRPLLPLSEMAAGGYITAACSPVVYTADLFPEDYRGNTFICEPANNLIHRDVLAPQGATFVARRGEADSEFLASTDPWFRPVHLSIGPDGALYILDFYREVIEDAPDIPEDVRKELKLHTGSSGRGRIWRVVPEGAPRPKKPALRRATTAELVEHLADGNSWWRLTAQRLLVERQDKIAVPLLEKLAREAKLPVGRAHALWTLQGLRALDDVLIEQALKDPAAGVREQALRLAESHLAANARLCAAATALAKDDSPRVRFQLAFTLGETDSPEVVAALAEVARRDAADPWTQTAVLSSVRRTAPGLLQTLARDREFTGKAAEPQLQFLTRLAALVGARATDAELAQAMRLLPASADEGAEWPIAILEGLGQGLRNSRRSPSQFWEQPPPALRESVAQLRPFFQRAATRAQDDKRAASERIAAVRLLGYGPFAVAAPTLQELLTPRHAAEMQLAAVRALALQDNPKVAELLLDGWNRLTPTVRREALEALFARADRLSQLLTAIERKKVHAAQLEPARVEQLRKHPNGELRQRAQKLLAASTPDRKKVVEDYRSALRLKADVARGKVVFQKNCATCHRLEDVGTEVGPDLAAALRNKTPEGLLTDILDPSREVDPRYLNYLVTARDGRTFTGLIVAETAASITLRRAEKAEDTILRTRIEDIQGTGKSVMPEGLETQLSKQDVADAIAYLLSQAAPK